MPTLTIDGKSVTVPPGTTVFNACKSSGTYVPNYCYHPGLSVAGVCRICLVDIKGQPKPAISCNTPCADGMEVFTRSDKALKARKGVMEFLLANHPLDCPTCDQAGECELQDFAAKENQLVSRFSEEKSDKPRVDFGEHIQYVPNRCILCTRCVRFGEEVSGSPMLGIVERGGHAEIALFPGSKPDDGMFSNVADVCPVGALLVKDHLHEGRAWFLKRTATTCPSCSRGCSIWLDSFRDKVTRIRPRHAPKVNGWWICDEGRYHTGYLSSPERLKTPLHKGKAVSWDEAMRILVEGLDAAKAKGRVIAVGSAWATNEENAALKTAAARWGGRPAAILAAPDGPAKAFKGGFTVDADRNPNRRGAEAALGALSGSWEAAGALLLNVIPDYAPSAAELSGWEKVGFKVSLDILPSAFTKSADLVLPVASFAETSGTFVNSQGLAREVRAGVRPPGEAREARLVLAAIAGALPFERTA